MFAGSAGTAATRFGFGGWGPGRGGPGSVLRRRWPPGRPRRHPRRDPGAALRAGHARLPDHPRAQRAHGRGVAAEPRLGLSDAAAARGRGARLRAEVRHRPARVRADRGRARAGGGAAVAGSVGAGRGRRPTTSTPTCAAWCSRCSERCARWPARALPPRSRRRQEVLRTARRSLYQILAEDDAPGAGAGQHHGLSLRARTRPGSTTPSRRRRPRARCGRRRRREAARTRRR